MPRTLVITAGKVTARAELNDSPTADALWAALPITGRANTWGDEIYFRIPVAAESADDARAEMTVGELAYWPPGSAFCIFFGRTPASSSDAPAAASPVNPLGRIVGQATVFKAVRDGETVRLTKGDDSAS
jgi:hypothetical protein